VQPDALRRAMQRILYYQDEMYFVDDDDPVRAQSLQDKLDGFLEGLEVAFGEPVDELWPDQETPWTRDEEELGDFRRRFREAKLTGDPVAVWVPARFRDQAERWAWEWIAAERIPWKVDVLPSPDDADNVWIAAEFVPGGKPPSFPGL
jgi:hypothetical protein